MRITLGQAGLKAVKVVSKCLYTFGLLLVITFGVLIYPGH